MLGWMTRARKRVHRHEHDPHDHAVQFYGSELSLFTTVSGFLAEGLVDGEPAILIATPSHRDGIVEHLSARLIDCDLARRHGDLVILDSAETMDMFMIDGRPDAELFERHFGAVISQAVRDRGRTTVRAYGEMVDVLWKDGQTDAAIALEILWNKLAAKYSFSLLCGYAMGNFYKQSRQLEEVREQHSRIVGDDARLLPFRRRRIARSA
jgi:hypothetical protein